MSTDIRPAAARFITNSNQLSERIELILHAQNYLSSCRAVFPSISSEIKRKKEELVFDSNKSDLRVQMPMQCQSSQTRKNVFNRMEFKWNHLRWIKCEIIDVSLYPWWENSFRRNVTSVAFTIADSACSSIAFGPNCVFMKLCYHAPATNHLAI